jgi:hypothetical protein
MSRQNPFRAKKSCSVREEPVRIAEIIIAAVDLVAVKAPETTIISRDREGRDTPEGETPLWPVEILASR